ncbi:hypothetical protein PV08_06857 [Exophiala spinifera]|uniref:Stc1 domain-containing protein n=1 Tax=Exophiala spinifera TaxID=91928 RepID=A0A0D1YGF7_9EURO|nr:uncharacterized protein PV08_06857 [Exophiala spinifera]KIW14076.1 hypothetical protein PV08_06857 [Exophiala spinifera]
MALNADQSSLNNVDVGNIIECANCSRKLFRSRFSNNQFKKFQSEVLHARRGGPPAKLPRCHECTAGNVMELKCTSCGYTKAIDFFSGQQRRNPDEAKCINCQQEIQDRLPGLKESAEEEQIRLELRANRLDPLSGMSSIGSSLPSATGSIAPSQGGYQKSLTTDGRVRVPRQAQSEWGDSQLSRGSSSSAGSEFPGRWANSTSEYPAVISNRGFDRVGAYKPPVSERARHQLDREQIQKAQAELGTQEESDADEDWEL